MGRMFHDATKNVPMLLMSATLHRPENFANWLEKISTKRVVLAQTHIRQVPSIINVVESHPSLTKKIKDQSLVLDRNLCQQTLLIKTDNFTNVIIIN